MSELQPSSIILETALSDYDDLKMRIVTIFLGACATMYTTTRFQMRLLPPDSPNMVELFYSFRDSLIELQRTVAIVFREIISQRNPLIFMFQELEVFYINALVLCGQLLQIQEAIVRAEYETTDEEAAEVDL